MIYHGMKAAAAATGTGAIIISRGNESAGIVLKCYMILPFFCSRFSAFASSDRRKEVDEGVAHLDLINSGRELLRIKRSKGMSIRNGRRRIERMEERSSDECILFLDRQSEIGALLESH